MIRMIRRSHSGAVCVNAWRLYGFQPRVPTCRDRAAAAGTGKRTAGDVAAAGTGKRPAAAAGTGKRPAAAAGTSNKCVPRVL
jgi:hypothetical protein